jgi:hypothetical protein
MHLVPIPVFAEALMALKTRSRSQSVGEDDSPEDILEEKYRGADGVREVDPSEITSATPSETGRHERSAWAFRNAVGGGERHGGRGGRRTREKARPAAAHSRCAGRGELVGVGVVRRGGVRTQRRSDCDASEQLGARYH